MNNWWEKDQENKKLHDETKWLFEDNEPDSIAIDDYSETEKVNNGISNYQNKVKIKKTLLSLGAMLCVFLLVIVILAKISGTKLAVNNRSQAETKSNAIIKEDRNSIIHGKTVQVSARYKDSVVLVELQEKIGNQITGSSGSGFIYDKRGFLLTNHHVVGNKKQAYVTLSGYRGFKAKVIAIDEELDVAVLKISSPLELLPFSIRENEPGKLGEPIVVMGYPFGEKLGREVTVTEGIISSIRRQQKYSWYQVSAPINPGNSGGPCIDADGRVIGIVTSKFGKGESIGFVRPIQETAEIRVKAARVN